MSTNLIDADVPCMQCGYNLRTLPREGACPECGQAVDRSERLHILHNSKLGALRANGEAWLGAMRSSLAAAWWAWVASFSVFALFLLDGGRTAHPPDGSFLTIVWLLPFVVPWVISHVAAWHAMAPRHRVGMLRLGRVLVVMSVLTALLLGLNLRVSHFYSRLFGIDLILPSDQLASAIGATAGYLSMVWPVVAAGMFGRFSQLAWMSGRRVASVVFSVSGLLVCALLAIHALALSMGRGDDAERAQIIAAIPGPTGSFPAVWLEVAEVLPRLEGFIRAPWSTGDTQRAIVIGLGLLSLALGLLIRSLRNTLMRAIELGGLPEASFQTSPSPRPSP